MEWFGLILSIGIAVYLAIDAPKRGKSPVLWAILGFVFGTITLGIYLIKIGQKVLGWIILILSIAGYIFIIFSLIALVFLVGAM